MPWRDGITHRLPAASLLQAAPPHAMKHALLNRITLASALLLATSLAHADIQIGDGTAASATAGQPVPELVLIIWDRTAKVSYTKDLGIAAYASAYAAGDTSKNLFVYGQQDTGFQQLFPALNTDSNFTSFLAASSGVANQVWAVVGAELNADSGGIGAESFTLFTTLNTGNLPNGTTNPAYFDFAGVDVNGNPNTSAHFNNAELVSAATNFSDWTIGHNNNAANLTNTHQCAQSPQRCSAGNAAIVNGSSFDVETSPGYAGFFLPGGNLVSNGHGNILNPVGKSSWFYRGTVSSDISDDSILVDEFDNLGHDAYWGLGVDTNGNYILSYTLQASLAQPQTAAGALLRLRTDFAAQYGRTRLIDMPVGAVSPVPEPGTWGLMGLGLAVLAARARRRA